MVKWERHSLEPADRCGRWVNAAYPLAQRGWSNHRLDAIRSFDAEWRNIRSETRLSPLRPSEWICVTADAST
jgi:hypothetical protein